MVLGSGRERMSALLEEMATDNRVDLLKHLDPQVVEELLPLVARPSGTILPCCCRIRNTAPAR